MKTNPWLEHIRQTLAIDPNPYSLKVSENRWRSFGYAVAGVLHMLRYAPNIRIQALATFFVISLGVWLKLGSIEWAILVWTLGINWLAEFFNAAIEATVNLASPERHPMAQVAKDVAAGAVLLAACLSLIIAGLILVPPLEAKLL